MSTTSRGKAFENLVAQNLKESGWHIMFKSIRVRFGAIDFDGLWDIVAVKRHEQLSPSPHATVQWFFIQCKSRKLYGKEKQELVDWMLKYGFVGINCAIAVKTKIKNRVGIDWEFMKP
jgi:hypothetical protein